MPSWLLAQPQCSAGKDTGKKTISAAKIARKGLRGYSLTYDLPQTCPTSFRIKYLAKTHAPLFDLYDPAINEAWIKARFLPEVLGKALGGSAPKPLVNGKGGEFWYEADRLLAHCARGLAVWKTQGQCTGNYVSRGGFANHY